MGLGRFFQYYLIRLIRVRDNHLRVQRGAAIGVAIHSIPLFGISLLVALALAFPFRANKMAVTIANLMSAPLSIPIYGLDALFTRLLMEHLGLRLPLATPIGVFLSFAVISLISYFVAGIVMKRVGAAVDAKLVRRRQEREVKYKKKAIQAPSES